MMIRSEYVLQLIDRTNKPDKSFWSLIVPNDGFSLTLYRVIMLFELYWFLTLFYVLINHVVYDLCNLTIANTFNLNLSLLPDKKKSISIA